MAAAGIAAEGLAGSLVACFAETAVKFAETDENCFVGVDVDFAGIVADEA